MKKEYFQNDVIDLRILGDIGSVCIYRFPKKSHRRRAILLTWLEFFFFTSSTETIQQDKGDRVKLF